MYPVWRGNHFFLGYCTENTICAQADNKYFDTKNSFYVKCQIRDIVISIMISR
jgi:hypothetical protein